MALDANRLLELRSQRKEGQGYQVNKPRPQSETQAAHRAADRRTVDRSAGAVLERTRENREKASTYRTPTVVRREGAQLESAFREYRDLSRWETDERGRARLEELRQQYGSEDALLELLERNQREQESHRRAEEYRALAGVNDRESGHFDPNFAALSGADDSVGDIRYRYINDPAFRTEYQTQLIQADPGAIIPRNDLYEAGLDMLTPEETAVYNYHYRTGGKEQAELYLSLMADELIGRKAKQEYKGLAGGTGREIAFGAVAGLDSFEQGMKDWFGGEAPSSVRQVLGGMAREDLTDAGWKLPEFLGGESLGQMAYDTVNTTANMAPSILAGTVGSMVGLGGVGTVMLGASAGGNARQEALREGYTEGQATAYGAMVGAAEAVMEKLLGGISSLGGKGGAAKLADKIAGGRFTSFLNKLDGTFWKIAGEIGESMYSEGAEEYLQEILDPILRNAALGEENELELVTPEALYSGLLGALTGGLLEGPGIINSNVQESRQKRLEAEAAEESSVTPEAAAEPVEMTVEDVENPAAETADSAPAVEENAENAQSTRTIEEAAGDFGEQAGAVVKYYEDGQDVERYVRGFREAYDMGKSGISQDYALRSASTEELTDHQRKQAWLTGKGAAALEAQRAGQTNAEKTTGGTVRKKGTVRAEGVTLQELQAGFNDRQKSAYKLLSTYAEASGVDVVLYRSQLGEDGRLTGESGSYHWDTSTVRLDVNAGLSRGTDIGTLGKYTMMKTYSHEFTHFCEQWSPEQYDSFRQEVFAAMEENGENPADLIEELMAEYADLDYDAASREVVAEAMVDILENSDFISRIAQTDKTLFDKLREKIAEFAQKVRDYWKGMVTTNARGAVAVKEQVGENLKYLEKIQKLWDDMAVNAVESYQATVAAHAERAAAVETVEQADETVVQEESASEKTVEAEKKPSKPKKTEKKSKAAEPVLDKPFPIIEPVAETATESAVETAVKAKRVEQDQYDTLSLKLHAYNSIVESGFEFSVSDVDGTRYNASIARSNGYVSDARKMYNVVHSTRNEAIDAVVEIARRYQLLDPLPAKATERADVKKEPAPTAGAATETNPLSQEMVDALVAAGGKRRKLGGKDIVNFGPWKLLDKAAKLGYDVDKGDRDRLQKVKSYIDIADGSIHSGDELLRKTLERIVTDANTSKEETDHGEETPAGVLADRPLGQGDAGVSGEHAAADRPADDAGGEPVGVSEPGERPAGRDDAGSDAEAEAAGGSGEGDRQSGVSNVSEEPAEAPKAKKPRKKATPKETAAEESPTAKTEDAPAPIAETVQEAVERSSTEEPGGNNWVIGESLELPQGSAARMEANLEAIRIIKRLNASGQNATAAEQAHLAKFVGWGGLDGIFDERKPEYAEARKELKELLTEEEYRSARASTTTAFYTDIGVIRAMYDGLKGLGFTGGRLLEPAAGVGHFAGAMPADLRQSVRSMTMVELDSITGSIAKHLYPGMDVRVEGFEKTNLPGGFMDAAVGNVPFGPFGVVDKTYPKKITAAIHNYFFAKTLDKVRTGGIVMMITSRHTMDSSDATVREYISKRADLLGAIRLPNTAFKGNAGTEVVSDILILKKRTPGTPYGGQDFVKTDWHMILGKGSTPVNNYFMKHPEMVMGKTDLVRGRYGLELTVNPGEGDLGQQIREAFGKIEGRMDYPAVQTVDRQNFAVERAAGKPKSGGYALKDGKLVKSENGSLVDAKVDEKTAKRLTGMIGIRDAARKLQNVQQQGLNADTIRKARKELNRLYDEFVAKYGFLNAPANRNAIREDPDRYSLLALENYDTDTRSGSKADIFTKNTIAPNRTVTSAETVAEGLIVSRNQTDGVDTALIARLTGKTEEEVTRELIDTRLAFKRADGTLEAAETYLSGNVRAKLREAEGLAPMDKDFRNNVEALRPIIPKDIPHTEIHVNPGATWVPPMVYGDFAAEMLGGSNNDYRSDVAVKYRPQTGTYVVELNSHYLKYNARNTQKWGAGGKTFIELLEAMLNSKSITVWRKVGDNRVVDETATAAANEKVARIAEEFHTWLWKDAERRTELGRLYNEQFNCLVNPKYDGSSLTFNGMNAGIQLRPHQKDAIQRIISSGGNTLLAHRVGAGKTFEMAAAAMKLKELGLVKKPMFAVPKSLVAQWGKEFADLFPTARLMVAEAGDFTPDNRKLFANRVANGDYDAVIVSYEQFEKLPISTDFSRRLYQDQVDEIVDAIAEAKRDAGKQASVKDLERTRKSLENKIKKLTDSAKDDDIRFEELGVDALFVDEAHNFKNLFYTTSMTNVAGLGNKDGSKRAFDLYTKVRYLQQLNGGRGIVFATATPVMNSMAEMYIMQRYLQPKMLEQLGVDNFDAWAKQFGEVVNGVEIKPSGQGYRVKQSFSRFKNLPELQLLFRNMADVMTQVPGLEVPKMKGGKVQVIECKPGQFQKEYMKELETRADHIKGVDPSVDNMLKITSDGRKISYTQRMIEPSLPYEEGCKLFRCADKVLEVYKKTSKDKGTQMIFLDMATPKGKAKAEAAETEENMDLESARLYEDLRVRLIDGGIPAKEIAFIHDADTDAKKKKLFQSVNDGDVRVLIGSTDKMGVGMNAQRRAVAIHHLDAPWRPGDVEQRNGRVFRQGNRNKEVSCFHYVTVGSFDARLWDILERKQGFIDQVMEGGDVGREAEDTGEVTLSAAEVKALASGSPLILEQVKLQTEIKKLENLRRAHGQAVMDAARGLAANRAEAKTLEGYIAKAGEDLKRRTDAYMDKKFKMTIGRKTYTDIKEAGAAMMAAAEKSAKDSGYTTIGSFAGFDLRVVKTAEGIQAMLSGAQGYTFKTYPKNTTHMINVMRDTAGHIDSARKAWQSRLERARADIAEQEALADKPFEQEAELDAARKRYNEIMRQLTPGNEQRLDQLDGDGNEGKVQYSRRIDTSGMDENAKEIVRNLGREQMNARFGIHRYASYSVERMEREIRDSSSSNPNYARSAIAWIDPEDFIRATTRSNDSGERIRAEAGNLDVSRLMDETQPIYLRVDVKTGEITGHEGRHRISALGAAGYDRVAVILRMENTGDGRKLEATKHLHLEGQLFDESLPYEGVGKGLGFTVRNILPLSRKYAEAARSLFTEVEGGVSFQKRREELTDREVLEMAAGEIDRESLTDAERAALDIIYTKLRGLEALEDRRRELGQLYREQQFGRSVDREAAKATLVEMHELDKQIPQAENAVLEGNSATLKAVLRKARKVVREQERVRGEQKLKRYRERRNNSAQIKKYRDRITTDVNEMMDWVIRPDGKNAMKHIPEALRGAVLPFLESIDMTSKRALGGGADTKADAKYRRRLEALRDAIHDNYAQSYAAWELPPDFMDKLDKQLRALREITDGSSGGILNQMTAQELKDLSEIVANLKKFIRNFNRFHANAMMQHVHEAGDSTIRELRLSPSDNGSTGGVKNFLFWKNIKPAYAFERFGLGGKAIWDGLRRGQSKLAFRTKEIEEFSRKTWTAKQVKAWEKEVHHIDLRGDKITMTTADIMSFYELCKRPQALSHILGDGGRIATRTRKLGEGKDAQIVDYGHQFNEEDIQTICDVLTEEQKKVADAMQQYMAKVGGAWGNEVSMHRFGVQQFGEDTYFPISVDSSFIDATVDERPNSASLYSLLNMGFTKALTPEAKNRIVVYSIFDVFATHMGEMASYNAMALPVLDAVKWLNYSGENADTSVSVRDELRRVYGAPGEGGGKSARGYAEKFIVNILRGFNGTEAQAAPNDSTGLKMLHRYNRAQVAFNLRVMVQQPTAILRAGMILDTKAILSGLKSIPVLKKNIAEMRRYSGIAAWKGLGFYDVNISRGLNAIIKQDGTFLDKATDLGLKGAEMADSATWGAIWYACKSQVVRSGVKTADAGFFPKVTELFEEVIYKTQVVDSILTKTEYMRDKGFFSRLANSFMGEPVTSANMLLDTAQKIDVDRRRGMSPAWLVKTHGGELARRTVVYSLSGLATVAIASLIDALRDDDDYQDYWEKWQEAFTGDIGEELNPLGKLPLVSDAWDLLRAVWETAAGGDPWVQVANLPMADIASYAVQGTEILRDKFTGEDTNYTWYGGAYKLLQALSGASGAPMAALTRDIVSVWNAMFPSLKVKTYDSGQKSEIKFAYLDGWLSQEEAMTHLLEQELVEDEDEGYWLIRKWDENEGWSRFQELAQAVLGNGDVNAALSELTGHGYDADEAASEVKSELGKMYRDREIDRPALEKALRNKVFGMDADEIKATVDKWSCEIVTGIAYGDIRDAYLDGKITAARAAEMRQRYGGESREDALETVREWQCEKDTGVAYSDIADAFSRGKITEAQAKRMYITYGGMSEEDAAEKAEVMAFVRDNPDCKGISYAALEGYRESCEGSGVKPADYYKVWKFNSTAQADVDESGKSISGSKKRKVLEYIDSMNLTVKQKDSLYYAFGWAKSTIGDAPWH